MNKYSIPNVSVLSSHPIQYYVPVYRVLAKDKRINLKVIFRTKVGVEKSYDAAFEQDVMWDVPLLDGYPHIFLTNKKNNRGIEFGILLELFRFRPDVMLVHAYHQPTNILAILLCKLLRIRVIIRSDTIVNYKNKNPGLFRRVTKRMIFSMAYGFAAIGNMNREFYKFAGVPEKKIGFAPFCVDNKLFSLNKYDREHSREGVRLGFGISRHEFVVLVVSKLISIKKIDDVILACNELSGRHKNLVLLVIGSGPEEQRLRSLAARNTQLKIVFGGFCNQSVLPGIYNSADLFVLASSFEQWGLVVNEAMAAGLPVVVSDKVGCGPDLVKDKSTGIVYPCGSVPDLAAGIEKMILDPIFRELCSKNARKVISSWDVEVCAENLALMFLSAALGEDLIPKN